MKYLKIFYPILFILVPLLAGGQDTIYSTPYPNGIITRTLKTNFKGYRFSPIDNPNLEIVVGKSETIKICYSSTEIFTNETYTPSDIIVLSSQASSGKIYYSEVLEYKGVKQKKII